MPKISCIMPVYNTNKYLEEAIKSILNQSFTDFEFIISDDGSTDGSKEIIQKYANIDHRITFIDNLKNRGISENLNDMIEKAKGEYIAIMESDDISMKNRFSTIVKLLEENNDIYLIGSCAEYIDSLGNTFIKKVKPSKIGLLSINNIFNMGIITPTFIFRKNIVEKIGKIKYKYIWDYELYIKILTINLGKILNINYSLVKKRIHSESTYKKNWKIVILELLKIRIEIIKENKLGKVKYVKAYFLYIYLYVLNIIRDILSKNKYYKKIYSIFRNYLNIGL